VGFSRLQPAAGLFSPAKPGQAPALTRTPTESRERPLSAQEIAPAASNHLVSLIW